jgi:hypothetical protein
MRISSLCIVQFRVVSLNILSRLIFFKVISTALAMIAVKFLALVDAWWCKDMVDFWGPRKLKIPESVFACCGERKRGKLNRKRGAVYVNIEWISLGLWMLIARCGVN